MNKNEASWLVVRTVGLLALIQSIRFSTSIPYLLYILFSGGTKAGKEDFTSRLILNSAWPSVIGFFVSLACAYYLLKDGKKVHALLVYEPKNH